MLIGPGPSCEHGETGQWGSSGRHPPAKPARPGSAHGLLAKQTQSAVVPEQGGGSCWSRAGEEQAEGAFDWEVSWGWERWEAGAQERSLGPRATLPPAAQPLSLLLRPRPCWTSPPPPGPCSPLPAHPASTPHPRPRPAPLPRSRHLSGYFASLGSFLRAPGGRPSNPERRASTSSCPRPWGRSLGTPRALAQAQDGDPIRGWEWKARDQGTRAGKGTEKGQGSGLQSQLRTSSPGEVVPGPRGGGGGWGTALRSLQLAGQGCAGLEGVGQAGWGRSPSAPPPEPVPTIRPPARRGPHCSQRHPEMKTALLFLVTLAVAAGPGEGLGRGWGWWGWRGPWKPGVAFPRLRDLALRGPRSKGTPHHKSVESQTYNIQTGDS